MKHKNFSKYKKLKRVLSFSKIKCLIINPNHLAFELANDSKVKEKYVFNHLNLSNASDYSQISNRIKQFEIILLDNSSKNNYNPNFLTLINNLKLKSKKIYDIRSFYENATGRIPLIHLSEDWVLSDDLFFISQRWHLEKFKRFFDVTFAVSIFPVCLIIASIGMLLIKISSSGPVLFKQKRIGKNGIPFTIYKLRTMIYNPSGHNSHTVKNDSRIFPVGLFLRKTKIDELPQLINVLVGHMSIIGPRPEKADIVAKLSKENPYYPLRHTIRPGITGWAQINNPVATPNENLQKLEFDLYYIKNTSYLLEFKIIWKTIKIVISGNSL